MAKKKKTKGEVKSKLTETQVKEVKEIKGETVMKEVKDTKGETIVKDEKKEFAGVIRELKPYRVTVAKREVRKPKALYETKYAHNFTVYTDKLVEELKKVTVKKREIHDGERVKESYEVETIPSELLTKLDAIAKLNYTNNLTMAFSSRRDGLHSTLSDIYCLHFFKIPEFKQNGEITGFTNRLFVFHITDHEPQLGQFALKATSISQRFLYELYKSCNALNSTTSVILINSKNLVSTLTNGELESLDKENYLSVQNREVWKQLYLGKKALSKTRYGFLSKKSCLDIINILDGKENE